MYGAFIFDKGINFFLTLPSPKERVPNPATSKVL